MLRSILAVLGALDTGMVAMMGVISVVEALYWKQIFVCGMNDLPIVTLN